MDEVRIRRAALLVATLSAFLTPFMASSVLIALPTIGREFGIDAVLLSWVATAFILAAAVFLIPFGRLADIHGRKRVFAWGTAVYTVSTLCCGLAPSAWALIGLRALQGVGSTMLFGTGTAILTSVFPPGERGRVLGINVATVYLGLTLGPPLGGLLTQQFGWRSVFLVTVPLGLVILALVLWRLPGEWAEARGERFDIEGAGLYGTGLVLLAAGLSEGLGSRGALQLAGGLVVLGVFVWWEGRVAHPMLPLGLFRKNPVFAFSNLAALIHYSATFATAFLLSLYLQDIRGLSPRAAGLVLLCQPALMALCSPFAGRLSDRVEPRTVASIGMGLTASALGLLALLGRETPLSQIAATLALLGVGYALFSSPNTNAVMGAVDRRAYGLASATVGTMRLLGQMLSMGTASLLLALAVGRQQITAGLHGEFLMAARTGFTLFALLCVGGIFASLARGRVRFRRDSGGERV